MAGTISYEYDALDRLTQVSYGEGTVVQYSYDPAGNRTQRVVSASATTLNVSVAGTGAGTVTSAPAGIDCGSSCTAEFTAGAEVTLTALAAPGSAFAGWTGACSGTTSTCTVTMDAAQSVTATFSTSLGSGGSVTGLSGLAGSAQSFAIEVPSGADTLTIRITGGVGQVELYVRFGALATLTEYDCYQSGDASELICVIESPQAGTYFITITGVTDFSGVSLEATTGALPGYACSSDEDYTLTFGPQPGATLEVQGCRSITVEAGATVPATSTLALRASERIRFRPGFRVESGGRLTAAIGSGALSASTLSSEDDSETTVLMVASTDESTGSTDSAGTLTLQGFAADGSDSTATLGANSFEDEAMATPLDLASLCAAPPADLAAVAGDQSVQLTWSAVPEGDGYQAYWSLTPGIHPYTAASYLGFAQVQESLAHAFTGLENDQEHYFVVTVTCGGDESPPSVEVTATPRVGSMLIAGRYRLDALDASTVVDLATGLEWQRCALGQQWDGAGCTGSVSPLTFAEAHLAAADVNRQAGADEMPWRVPEIAELHGLVYCTSGVPAHFPEGSGCWGSHGIPTLEPTVFPPGFAAGGWFWSDSTHTDGQVWGVDFDRGIAHPYHATAFSGVRLVRPAVADPY